MSLQCSHPIELVVTALERECRDHPLATLSEGYLKAQAAAELIQSGFAIIEGSNRKNKGWKVTLSAGVLKPDRIDLARSIQSLKGKRTSPDLRIETASGRVVVELQARCIVGSSSQLLSKNIKDDIERVQLSIADAFILVADREIYLALRGIKKAKSGRKAGYPELFSAVFPAIETLGATVSWSCPGALHEGLETRGSLQSSTVGVQRVIAVVMRHGSDKSMNSRAAIIPQRTT